MEGALWYLKSCDLFARLTSNEIERLERHARIRGFKRRALIYAPDEPGESVFVLASGRVKIKDLTPDGKEAILAFIDEGEIFGELALVDDEPRREYAEAVTDVKVLLLPCEELEWLMERRPDLALSVTKLVGLRRRRIENRLRNILFLPSRARLVRLLLELIDSHGVRRGPGWDIGIPLSHQELASLIGVTRETVTATLGQLRQDGLISVRRRRISVIDAIRLAAECGESTGRWADDRVTGRRL